MRGMPKLGVVGVVAASILLGTASAQPAPWRLVQSSDGTLYVIAGDVRHRIVPAPIDDDELETVAEAEPWEDGTILAAAPPAPAPPPPPAAPPVPPAAPAVGEVRLDVTERIAFRDSTGTVLIQGLIQNNGSASAGSIDIALSLIDAGGATVGAAAGDPALRVIRPGQRVPFSASLGNAPDFVDVRIQVQARPASALDRYTHDFRAEGVTVVPGPRPLSRPRMTGQVVNVGSSAATLVRVTVAVYSPEGALMEVRDSFAKLDEIAPGQSSPFEIDFVGGRQLRELPRYELFIEGRPRN